LQRALLSRGLFAVGIDESAPMGRLAHKNLGRYLRSQTISLPADSATHNDYTQARLIRGLAQHLPFPGACFDTVVATFPADYIFNPVTLEEADRALVPGGRFVILPGASIMGRGLMDRVMAFVFRITGETPPNLSGVIQERSKGPLSKAGFTVEFHELEIRSSLVMILVATKAE
jgi:SAM-dependent methyltransferase